MRKRRLDKHVEINFRELTPLQLLSPLPKDYSGVLPSPPESGRGPRPSTPTLRVPIGEGRAEAAFQEALPRPPGGTGLATGEGRTRRLLAGGPTPLGSSPDP